MNVFNSFERTRRMTRKMRRKTRKTRTSRVLHSSPDLQDDDPDSFLVTKEAP